MISGANADPDGLKNWAYYLMKIQYYLKKDVKIKMMLEQPHINEYQLISIGLRAVFWGAPV